LFGFGHFLVGWVGHLVDGCRDVLVFGDHLVSEGVLGVLFWFGCFVAAAGYASNVVTAALSGSFELLEVEVQFVSPEYDE
jgi:hypothetical protein